MITYNLGLLQDTHLSLSTAAKFKKLMGITTYSRNLYVAKKIT